MRIDLDEISVLRKRWFAWRLIDASELWDVLRPMSETERLEALSDPARFQVYAGRRPVSGDTLVDVAQAIDRKLFGELSGSKELEDYLARNTVNGCRPLFAEEAQSVLRAIQTRLRVFLLHSRDDSSYARVLAHRLAQGSFDPWFDEAKAASGSDWSKGVTREVMDAHAVLVCLSPRSVAKHAYVREEIHDVLEAARQRPAGALFVIPVRLEPCELPEALVRYPSTDYYTEDGHQQLLAALRRAAEGLARYPQPWGLKPA